MTSTARKGSIDPFVLRVPKVPFEMMQKYAYFDIIILNYDKYNIKNLKIYLPPEKMRITGISHTLKSPRFGCGTIKTVLDDTRKTHLTILRKALQLY